MRIKKSSSSFSLRDDRARARLLRKILPLILVSIVLIWCLSLWIFLPSNTTIQRKSGMFFRNQESAAEPPLAKPKLYLPSPERAVPGPIPHILIFTYSHNVLETGEPKELAENVRRTIDTYRRAWDEPGAPVRFLTDEDCRDVLARVAPTLVRHFDWEYQGMYRADLCRVAALYDEGGYYFDVDLRVIHPLELSDEVGFATSLEPWPWKEGGTPEQTNFFQAFVASRAKHPILRTALRVMELYYTDRHELHGFMGTSTLRDAYDAVPEEVRGTVRLLVEDNLDTSKEYPDAERQEGEGCCCNYFVHDPAEHVIYFYARIPLPEVHQSNCQIPMTPEEKAKFYGMDLEQANMFEAPFDDIEDIAEDEDGIA